jgi:FMN phosphatase YigB (HAD superfamily)
MKPCVLLDFDGVVLRSHPASSHISARCTHYAKQFIKVRNPIKAAEINRHLYTNYGHTVLGLQKLGFQDANLFDFNRYVYDSFDYSGNFKSIRETHKTDSDSMFRFFDAMESKGIGIKIFSNAPPAWCSTILGRMCPGIEAIECIPSTSRYLKPQLQCYAEAERFVSDKGYDHCIFIDDSMLNLGQVVGDPKWTNILFSREMQDSPIILKNRLFVVSNLKQAAQSISYAVTNTIAPNASGPKARAREPRERLQAASTRREKTRGSPRAK